jgi:hypothetical protein
MRNVTPGFTRLGRSRGGRATTWWNSRVWSLGKRTMGLFLSSRGEGGSKALFVRKWPTEVEEAAHGWSAAGRG